MTFLLCKATKRPVDKRKNPEKTPNQTKAHKKQAQKKIKPTTEQKKFIWHVLAPCFRYTFNAILTHANDRTQPYELPPFFQVQVVSPRIGQIHYCLSDTHRKKKQGVAALKGLPLIRRNVRQNISLSNLLPRPGSTQSIGYIQYIRYMAEANQYFWCQCANCELAKKKARGKRR